MQSFLLCCAYLLVSLSFACFPISAETVMPVSARVPFIENVGHLRDGSIKYYAETFGGTVYIKGDRSIVYLLPVTGGGETGRRACAIEETIAGAETGKVSGEKPVATSVNYFIGRDPSKWRRNIPAFNIVSLGEVSKGIVLKLRAHGNNVEKLFFVSPGSDPGNIRLEISGSDGIAVNSRGELEITTELGVVKFTKPVAYQDMDEGRKHVEAAYSLEGNSYGFRLGRYDTTRPLVIDPLLASTFVGGGERDKVSAIGLDGNGNVFVAGQTLSAGFPVTAGAYDETYNGFGHVTDYTLSARMKIVKGYLGFRLYQSDVGNYEVEFSAEGNVFIGRSEAGSTNGATEIASTDIGSLSPAQWYDVGITVSNKTISVFTNAVQVLSGQDTNASALPGGPIAVYTSVDDGGGWTSDAYIDDLIVSNEYDVVWEDDFSDPGEVEDEWGFFSWGPIEPRGWVTEPGGTDHVLHGQGGSWGEPEEIGGDTDVFVAKFDPSLSNLIACTYLGGNGNDGDEEFDHDDGPALAVDGSGNVYVTGETESYGFPTTPGSYDTKCYHHEHAFVSKFNNHLDTLVASTVLPDCEAAVLKIDSTGSVYVAGETGSAGFVTTPGAYDRTFNGFGVWSDYSVHARIQIIEGTLGISFHDSDLGKYEATFSDTEVQVNKHTSSTDVWTNLATAGASGLTTGQWYDVEVAVSNGHISVYTNDKEVLSTQDTSPPILPGGEVEIWDWNDGFDVLAYLDDLGIEKSGTTIFEEGFDDDLSTWSVEQCDIVQVDSNNVLRLQGDEPVADPDAFESEDDAFICKLDADLANLLAATFLGGVGEEEPRSLAVNNNGDVYLCGQTESPDFPITSNAYDRSFDGAWTEYDVHLRMKLVEGEFSVNVRNNYSWHDEKGYAFTYFVCFRSDVVAVKEELFSVDTLLDQAPFTFATDVWYDVAISLADDGLDVAVNGTNLLSIADTDPLIVGCMYFDISDTNETGSAEVYVDDLVVTNGAILFADDFEDGDNSDWSVDSDDEDPDPKGWDVVQEGCDYVLRGRGCADTAPPWRHDFRRDGFVSKLDANLTDLLGSTFLGHDDEDDARAIVIGAGGDVYVGGYTWSRGFPATPGAYSEGFSGGHVGFISMLDGTLTNLVASTVLGTGGEIVDDMAIGADGNIYVVGSSWGGLPMTWDPFDGTHNGSRDAIAAKLDPALTNLMASTFLGGSQWDEAYALCIDTNGNVYVAGMTESWDFPVSNGYEEAYMEDDSFVARLDDGLSGPPRPVISVSPGAHNFGHLYRNDQTATQTFAIVNVGKLPLEIGAITLTGGDTSEFSIVNDNASGQTNAPYGAETTTVEVVYAPSSLWGKAIILSIPSNDPDTPTNKVPVYGTGIGDNSAEDAFQAGLSNLTAYTEEPPEGQYHNTNYLVAADQDFHNALSVNSNHYGAIIYRMVTRFLLIPCDSEVNRMLTDFGTSTNGRDVLSWDAENAELIPTNSPTSGEAIEILTRKLITASDESLQELGRIPTNWTGCVIFGTNELRLDEDCEVDVGDVQMFRSALELGKVAFWTFRAYDLSFDFDHANHVDTPVTNITVDGNASDWAGIEPLFTDEQGDSAGSTNADIWRVYTAMDASNAYFMVQTYADIHTSATVEINFDYKHGQHFDGGEYDDLHLNVGTNSLSAWTNNMVPHSISGAVVARDKVVEGSIPLAEIENPEYFWATFVNIWSTASPYGDDPSEIEDPNPNAYLDQYPTLWTVTNGSYMATASNSLVRAIDFYNLGSSLIRNETDYQTDDLIIFDPDELDAEEDFRNTLDDVKHSLTGVVLFDSSSFSEFMEIGKFFVTQYVTRAHLPDFDDFGDMIEGTFPDPTFNGIFPHWNQWDASEALGMDHADSDGDGMGDLWETTYFGGLGRGGTNDFDEDGTSDLSEYLNDTDPTRKGPNWWPQRGVLTDGAAANDYAAVNQGQLKWIARQAYLALDARLDDGAGTDVEAVVKGFSTDNNYRAVNIGQLKNVAKPFYDRLIEEGLAADYPWAGAAATNDYATANIGQVKNVFSFHLP